MHLDHVLGLLTLWHALAYNPVSAPAPIPIWLPLDGIKMLSEAIAPFDACDEPGLFAATVMIAEYDPERPLPIVDVAVTFTPAVHYIPAWAMRVHSPEGADLDYTGDTGPTAPLVESFVGVGVLVAVATLLEPGSEPMAERRSLTATEAGKFALDADANVLVLTHMWEEFGFAAYRVQAAAVFPGWIGMASPGLRISW